MRIFQAVYEIERRKRLNKVIGRRIVCVADFREEINVMNNNYYKENRTFYSLQREVAFSFSSPLSEACCANQQRELCLSHLTLTHSLTHR